MRQMRTIGRDVDRCAKLIGILRRHAEQNLRCPTNEELAYQIDPVLHGCSMWMRQLIEDQRIRIEVYAKNYRVIWILEEPGRGTHTLLPARGGAPYRVLGAPRPPKAA